MCIGLQVIEIVASFVFGMMFIIWPSANLGGMVYEWTGQYLIDSGASCMFCMRVCWCVFSEETTNKTMFIVVGFVCLLVAMLEIWFFIILLACHRYLCDKLVAASSLPTTATVYSAQTNYSPPQQLTSDYKHAPI
jgi:hypothetical protein